MPKNVAIIAAYPDDEVLGCSGTIARYTETGDLISILILAEGLTSRDPSRSRDASSALLGYLAECAQKVSQILGAVDVKLLEFPDNRMDSVGLLEVIKTVEDWLAYVRPSVVYTHHVGDVNVDHTVVYRAVVTAC